MKAPLPAGILAEFRAGLDAAAPRPLLTVSQWADAHRVLPTKSGSMSITVMSAHRPAASTPVSFSWNDA